MIHRLPLLPTALLYRFAVLNKFGGMCGQESRRCKPNEYWLRRKAPMSRHLATVPLMVMCLLGVQALAQDQITVHGIVRDAKTHLAISCAIVSAVGDQAAAPDCTDGDGQFDIILNKQVKIGGQIRIRVQKANYIPFDKKEVASPNQIIQVELTPLPLVPAQPPKVVQSPRSDRGAQTSSFTVKASDDSPQFKDSNLTFDVKQFQHGVSPGIRLAAVMKVGGMKASAKPAEGILIRSLVTEQDPPVRAAIAWAMGEICPNSKDCINALEIAVADLSNEQVRWSVARSLGKQTGTPSKFATSGLISALSDPDLWVRLYAAESLISLQSPSHAAIQNVLADSLANKLSRDAAHPVAQSSLFDVTSLYANAPSPSADVKAMYSREKAYGYTAQLVAKLDDDAEPIVRTTLVDELSNSQEQFSPHLLAILGTNLQQSRPNLRLAAVETTVTFAEQLQDANGHAQEAIPADPSPSIKALFYERPIAFLAALGAGVLPSLDEVRTADARRSCWLNDIVLRVERSELAQIPVSTTATQIVSIMNSSGLDARWFGYGEACLGREGLNKAHRIEATALARKLGPRVIAALDQAPDVGSRSINSSKADWLPEIADTLMRYMTLDTSSKQVLARWYVDAPGSPPDEQLFKLGSDAAPVLLALIHSGKEKYCRLGTAAMTLDKSCFGDLVGFAVMSYGSGETEQKECATDLIEEVVFAATVSWGGTRGNLGTLDQESASCVLEQIGKERREQAVVDVVASVENQIDEIRKYVASDDESKYQVARDALKHLGPCAMTPPTSKGNHMKSDRAILLMLGTSQSDRTIEWMGKAVGGASEETLPVLQDFLVPLGSAAKPAQSALLDIAGNLNAGDRRRLVAVKVLESIGDPSPQAVEVLRNCPNNRSLLLQRSVLLEPACQAALKNLAQPAR
jgi:HEAT repeats